MQSMMAKQGRDVLEEHLKILRTDVSTIVLNWRGKWLFQYTVLDNFWLSRKTKSHLCGKSLGLIILSKGLRGHSMITPFNFSFFSSLTRVCYYFLIKLGFENLPILFTKSHKIEFYGFAFTFL